MSTGRFLMMKRTFKVMRLNQSQISSSPKAYGKRLKSLPGSSIASRAVEGAEILQLSKIRMKIEPCWPMFRQA